MEELETAKKAALKAGEAILEIYKSDFKVSDKKEGDYTSPLTEADTKANELILEDLRKDFPKHGFLTEEEADDKGRLSKEYVWIIDPLDGTKEFIKRNGEFTVNIGLVKEGKPILGVIYVPAKGEMYYASEGEGAYYEKDGKISKIKVSEREEPEEMVLVKSRSHATEKLMKLVEKAGFSEVKTSGSSVKGCLVAKGEADVYYRFGRTMEWDICAMHCIIKEAGGKLTDLDGETIKYNKEEPEIQGFVCSNNKIHKKLVEMAKWTD